MKKTYINPTVKSYNIQTRSHLLQTSTEIAVSNYNFQSEGEGAGEILGREFEFDGFNNPQEEEGDFEY